MPTRDVALGSIVHKEVDVTPDPRLDAFQPESPHNGFDAGGFLDEVIEQETLIDAKKRDSVKSKASAAQDLDRSESRISSKHCNTNVVKRNGSKSAFQSMDSQIAVNTGKEIKPLQLQKSTATKKPPAPDVQTKSTRRSKRKRKEDLNEILRKRLDKLEAKLKMIGAQHSIPDADDSAEDISEEKEMGDSRRILSLTSHVEKKRKTHYNQNEAGDSKFAKRQRIIDDDPERIIAANVDGSATNRSDEYLSTVLKKESNPAEGLSTMSTDFSDEITSMIESQCLEHSRNNEFGNLLLSAAPEQLADTETILYNVLSQNLPEGHLSYTNHPACETEIDDAHNIVGVLPQVVDTNTFSLPCESVGLKLVRKEDIHDSEHLEDSKHLGCLSVDTQWDSQFVESFAVKSTHLNSVRDWRSQKLLDLLISGRLKEMPSGTSLELQHEETDRLVASSLQNILSNLSWLWSVAVGEDMLSSVQDVVSSTANNLDSLTIDFVENSGCVDIPVSMSLSSDQMNDGVTGIEIDAKQEDGWSCEESQLLDSLFTSLDAARQKVLNHTDKCSVTDVAEASAASFGSLLEHAINSSENTDLDVPGDLYSPTRPTEVEHALSGAVTVSGDVDRQKGLLHTEHRNEVQFLQSEDVTDALNDLIERSAPTRRTVRIHKKEDVTVITPTGRVTEAVVKGGHENSSSRVKGEENLAAVSSQMSYAGLTSDKPVIVDSDPSISEELPVNWSVDLSNIAEVEVATDGLPLKQTFAGKQVQDIKSAGGKITVISGGFDSSVENQYGMDSLSSPVASHKAKSSKKRSTSHDQMSDKSVSYHGGVKKDSRSRKQKDSSVDVTSKKNKKKPQDIEIMVDRRLKLDVRSELKHVQKDIESLLYEKYGLTIGSTTGIYHDVLLRVDDKHFPDLSGLSFDASIALMSGENKTDNTLKTECSTALLNDLLAELNIQLSTINLSLPKNSSVHATDRLVGEKLLLELSDANMSQLKLPSSPPSLRKRTGRPSSVSRRNKSSEEAGVNVTQHRQQELPVTENERRLMKADKLMQTFRRSQIAKRQNQKASPQPPASFIRQVRTVAPSEGLDIVDSDIVMLSSEAREPDFSTVITDGSMLASVELPHIPPKSLALQTDDADMQTLPPEIPDKHLDEAVSKVLVIHPDKALPQISDTQPDEAVPKSPDTHPDEAVPKLLNAHSDEAVPMIPDSHPDESVPELSDTQPDEAVPKILDTQPDEAVPKLPDTRPDKAVPVSTTPAPPCEHTVSKSAQHRFSSGGKEQRVYVFNSDKPVCQEVKVSSERSFLNCGDRCFV